MAKYIHESVAQALAGLGMKAKGSQLSHANNRASLSEAHIVQAKADDGAVTLVMMGHPQLSEAEISAKSVVEAKNLALRLCAKAGGFPIIGEAKDSILTCTFTRDKAKATVTETISEATTKEQDDETDGTGEPSGDTKTNTEVKNDKGVGTKKGTKADNKGEESSKDVDESELFNKEKLAAFKDKKAKRDQLAGKKEKSKEECAEMEKLDAELDLLSEQFYDSLPHSVTIVLFAEGVAEVHGLTEDEIAPFGGTPPAIPAKYSKKAKDAGPNSKVDNGVLTLHKAEGWQEKGSSILTGKDFKACGWGTPGKGTGKQGKWSDSGKMPLDAAKKLPAGTEK